MTHSVARKLRIHGRVQGVFYRESMRREAERYGVKGWVRNSADGTVEAHVQGAPEAVESLIAWCRRGPPAASVSEVRSEDAMPEDTAVFRVLNSY